MSADFCLGDGEHVPTLVECAVVGLAFTFELPRRWGPASVARVLATVRRQLVAASRQHTGWMRPNFAVVRPFARVKHQRANWWLLRLRGVVAPHGGGGA